MKRVSLLAIVFATGCFSQGFGEAVFSAVEDDLKFAVVASAYYCERGDWPESTEDLQAYYTAARRGLPSDAAAEDTDRSALWEKYSGADFERMEDGGLVVRRHFQRHDDSSVEEDSPKLQLRLHQPDCDPGHCLPAVTSTHCAPNRAPS
jgi:hypothetical protein